MYLGPSYSGSTLSMRQALESLPALCLPDVETVHVRIVTGTATSPRNPTVLQNPLGSAAPASCRGKPVPLDVTYTATVHDDGTLRRALHDELARINPAWRNGNRVALLVESNTPWGAGLEPPKNGTQAGAAAAATDVFGEALRLHFPLHVSHLAAVPDRRSIAPQLSRGIPLVPKAAILRLEDSVTPMDKLPTFTPDTSAPTIDLVLLRTLDNLERQGIGAVGIFATDVRDFLFLAREINRVAPNVLLFGAEPNILMLHHEYQPFVRGAIVASTYPLYSRTQALTGRSKRRKQFTSMGSQGRYNALLHLLGRDELLLDYATPTAASEEAGRQKPDPWVLVAGQHGFLPLGTRRVAGGVYPTMMTPASRAEPPDVDPPAYLFATWQKQVLWMLPALLAAAHLGLIVVSRYRRVPGLTAFATHRVHRPASRLGGAAARLPLAAAQPRSRAASAHPGQRALPDAVSRVAAPSLEPGVRVGPARLRADGAQWRRRRRRPAARHRAGGRLGAARDARGALPAFNPQGARRSGATLVTTGCATRDPSCCRSSR